MKNRMTTAAMACARMFFQKRCFEVSETLCQTRSFGPGAADVFHRPYQSSKAIEDAMTESIWREKTTIADGDGDSSLR